MGATSNVLAAHGRGAVAEDRGRSAAAPAERASAARNIALFAAAPFIGLAYLIVFPFIGFGALGVLGVRALATRR